MWHLKFNIYIILCKKGGKSQYWCYYMHQSRESVFPICGIFYFFYFSDTWQFIISSAAFGPWKPVLLCLIANTNQIAYTSSQFLVFLKKKIIHSIVGPASSKRPSIKKIILAESRGRIKKKSQRKLFSGCFPSPSTCKSHRCPGPCISEHRSPWWSHSWSSGPVLRLGSCWAGNTLERNLNNSFAFLV